MKPSTNLLFVLGVSVLAATSSHAQPAGFTRIDASYPQPISAIVSADFDRDGILDLAVMDRSDESTLTLHFLSGDGRGNFVRRWDFPTTITFVHDLLAADFNGDGILDLALHGQEPSGNGAIWVFLGRGNGTFSSPTRTAESSFVSMAAGDFNGDGRADLIVLGGSGHSSGYVLLSLHSGFFGTPMPLPIGGLPFEAANGHAAVADFNRDGRLDVVITLSDAAADLRDPPAILVVLRGTGDGRFLPAPVLSVELGGTLPNGLLVADVNGDGLPDIVAASTSLTVLTSHADGTFTSASYYPGFQYGGLTAIDVNGDGCVDIIADVLSSLDYRPVIFLGNPAGSFAGPYQFAIGGGRWVAGDFNRDGRQDIVATSGSAPYLFSLLNQVVDLSVTNQSDTLAYAGRTLRYHITVRNEGAGPASGPVSLIDTLAPGTRYRSWSGRGWDCTEPAPYIRCTGPVMAAGASLDLDLVADVLSSAPDRIINTVAVSTAGEANLANNSASASVKVVHPDLQITESHSADFTVGLASPYLIAVTNVGQLSTLDDKILITDTLPAGLSYVTGPGCNPAGNLVKCEIPRTLAPGETYSLTLSVLAGFGAYPMVTNAVAVEWDQDGNTANNTAVDRTLVHLDLLNSISLFRLILAGIPLPPAPLADLNKLLDTAAATAKTGGKSIAIQALNTARKAVVSLEVSQQTLVELTRDIDLLIISAAKSD